MNRSLILAAALVASCSSSSSSDLGGAPMSSGNGTGPTEDAASGGDEGGTDAANDFDAGGGTDSGGGDDTGTGPETGGGDGGPPVACTGMKYCDDFEKYTGAITNGMTLGAWKATVSGTLTAMTVDGMKPYSGAKALHLQAPTGASARGTLGQTAAAGLVASNDLYGRAMVYYSNAAGAGLPIGVHSWLFNAAGTSTAAAGAVTMNMGGGGAKMQLNYHPPAPKTEQSVQGGAISAGKWHCIQWQYDGSGNPAADAAKVLVDGAPAVTVTKAANAWDFATPWSSFDFGFTHYQTLANAVDVYLDDFALNDAMVPCPP